MKNKNYIVKGTPIVPAICGIGMVIVWYMFFYFLNGSWSFNMNSLSFGEMTGTEIYFTGLSLLVPVIFFIGVLFLAEINVRWMIAILLIPVWEQISAFVLYFTANETEYIFQSPVRFFAPFLALILFALTIEKVLPTKWIFVGFCVVSILLPLILTFCGVGEFTFTQQAYDAEYNAITLSGYLWSEYLSYALYYVGLGALVVQMRKPTQKEIDAFSEMQKSEKDSSVEE